MKEIENLKPFPKFCCSIGYIPTSYKVSMSYEEQLWWLCDFLENTVIPTVNQNGEAVEELQNLFVELKSYVDNYFENLDIQDEINNKLDEMAESGQLADIIAQYLELAGVLAYDTINDLKSADNLTNGSIAKTLGNTTYNDGYGAFYKIRTILNTDVVDNNHIVALTNFNNLIAEKIYNQYIEDNRNDINIINSKVTICVGDSYGVGITAGGQTIGWCDRLRNLMNLSNNEYYKIVEGGTGFVTKGENNHTFLELLQANISSITNKNIVKNIIVCAGYNDRLQNGTDINSAINNFITYCKNNFQNAKIYIGMCAVNSGVGSEQNNIRKSLYNDVLRSYQNCINYGGIYLNNIEYVLRNYADFMSSDNVHPNIQGYDNLANHIFQCLNSGSCDITMPHRQGTITLSNSNSTFTIYNKMVNENVLINSLEASITFTTAISSVVESIDLGTYNLPYYRDLYNTLSFEVQYYMMSSENNPAITFYGGIGKLHFREDGHLIFHPRILRNDGQAFVNVPEVYYIKIYPFEKTIIV